MHSGEMGAGRAEAAGLEEQGYSTLTGSGNIHITQSHLGTSGEGDMRAEGTAQS